MKDKLLIFERDEVIKIQIFYITSNFIVEALESFACSYIEWVKEIINLVNT